MTKLLFTIGMASLATGCGHNSIRSENAALRAKVAVLETQVAELKAQQAADGPPLSVAGLTLATPTIEDIRWAPRSVKTNATPTQPPVYQLHYPQRERAPVAGQPVQNRADEGPRGMGTITVTTAPSTTRQQQ